MGMASTETVIRVEQPRMTKSVWAGAAVAGIAGGIIFGMMMQMMMRDVLEVAIPGLFGLGPSLALGWGIHLFNSAVFGLAYAAVVQLDPLAEYAERVTTGAGLGLGYGVIIWVVAASIIMPLWVGAMLPMNPPVPDFNLTSLVGHAVYGLILGALYPLLVARV